MYKEKYYKYKNKHKKWIRENNFVDPDKGDGYNDDNPESVSDEELVLRDIPDEELDKSLEEKVNDDIQQFQGFDTKAGNDVITENLNQKVMDVGLFAKARGKVCSYDDFEKKDFIHFNNKPNKTKILELDNKNSFDSFTEKYGFIDKKDKNVYIKWDQVNKKYKGIYVASSVLSDRDDTIPYMGKTKANWVNHDLKEKYLDKAIIFQKYRNIMHRKEINDPFNGYVVDSYAIEENELAKIFEPINGDKKILFIDDVKSFDKFTKKYGFVKQSDIMIKWNKVKNDYEGVYIDKDNYFEKNRKEKAYFNDQLCNSWWDNSNIVSGLVYLFR